MSARNRQTAVGSELRNGGTRRRAPACLAVAVLTALALMTGCGQTNTAESIRIDELAEVHVGLDHELRLGRELAAGSHAIAVPINDGGAQLRLGVLPREEGSVPLKVRVSVGRDVLLDETASDSGVWYDRLVALPTGSAGECIVEIEAPGPVALGPCEIVPARSEKTSVLVFLIDALRLDHLGCYGYERETS
ncbi:MAG: hypothetical protein GY851_01295, partial [bacterium]|nr:hypothetical protein [bacterium]